MVLHLGWPARGGRAGLRSAAAARVHLGQDAHDGLEGREEAEHSVQRLYWREHEWLDGPLANAVEPFLFFVSRIKGVRWSYVNSPHFVAKYISPRGEEKTSLCLRNSFLHQCSEELWLRHGGDRPCYYWPRVGHADCAKATISIPGCGNWLTPAELLDSLHSSLESKYRLLGDARYEAFAGYRDKRLVSYRT
mmetsp:Transcript_101366/g.261986  ORF Transcript_101366/g.261986 Transcript_101366/m.261986 type:complete len:192 (-) Transcript_101366:21-596(-)